MENSIKIYTDGAARGNPGPSGWGAIILFYPYPASPLLRGRSEEGVIELGGRKDHATNNQMELTAPIEALTYVKEKLSRATLDNRSIEIYSDSKYVITGITEWIYGWQKNNWRNAAKKPVLNRELWEALFALTEELKPKWQYVAGHGTDAWNNRADEIATTFADNNPVELRK